MNKPTPKPTRQQKLAAKLKENLRRRKGQAKSRTTAKRVEGEDDVAQVDAVAQNVSDKES